MQRNIAYGIKPVKIWRSVLQIYGATQFEDVHPQQCGYFRRKDRTQRRPELPRVPALLFYPVMPGRRCQIRAFRRLRAGIHRMRKRLEKEPAKGYRDFRHPRSSMPRPSTRKCSS